MSTAYSPPDPGSYRLLRGVRVLYNEHGNGGLAICDYPLRAVRLQAVAAHLLALCAEQRSIAFLAQQMCLPAKRVEALCEQLCRRGLLETGPPLPPATWPNVSILIPSRNRAEQLERCLRSLLALDYPANALEIIVIDDASTDETHTMLQGFIAETATHGWQVRVVRHTARQGVGRGRNTGAEAASHDLLAYIDSDCVASPGWLKALVPAFQDARTGAVGGMLRSYERTSMLGRYEDVRSSLFMGVRAQEVQLEGPLTYVPTANVLLRRAAWQHIGGFSPLNFGEDVDLCRRLLAAGYRVRYLPYGTVYHDYRTRLRDFLRTRAAYAASEAVLLQLHPQERRVLLLPPEQGAFAGLAIGGLWQIMRDVTDKEAGIPVGARVVGRGGEGLYGRPLDPKRSRNRSIEGDAGDHKGPPRPAAPPSPLRISCLSLFHWFRWCPRPSLPSHMDTQQSINRPRGRDQSRPYVLIALALLLTLFGAFRRWRRVQAQRIPIGPLAVLRATLRGHLAYTYHLCRHVTRYYTLPLLLVGLLIPPLLPLALIPCVTVIGVDYVRLRPEMGLGAYALCAFLDDCAYGVGVMQGCIQQRTWKPLVPVIKPKLQ